MVSVAIEPTTSPSKAFVLAMEHDVANSISQFGTDQDELGSLKYVVTLIGPNRQGQKDVSPGGP